MTMKRNLLASATVAVLALPMAAQAHLTFFQGTFAPEALGATGSGTLAMEYDDEGHTLAINASWSGLSGTANNAHIHCCTASPNTGTAGVALAQSGLLPGFPLGASSGSYIRVIDLSSTTQYSAAFVTASGGTALGAENRLMSNLASGQAYFNIHTTTFGGGEIRAFVTAVPEPGTYALMLLGLAGVVAARRRRRAD
ncbi:PEP-CTERM putative exosortase interaction domain-containing protein [Burkholderiales bacterium JOSHI_001]|nr:PEP-CTERM putative exosortase interaction domain-containing protein [Burkholderiales bacterium JOSHI_001]